MKKISSIAFLFTCAFIHLASFASAQAPNWEWARTEAGVYAANGSDQSICVDAAGNSYVTGFFQNTVTFGTTTLISNADGPGPNMYLVKYNPWGGVVWAQNAGGHSGNTGEAVAVDDSGNVYVTGYFGDTIVFGSTTFISPPSTYGLAFLVKYNPSGNVVWAKALGTGGGSGGTVSHAVATDHSGNIFVTGYFLTPSATFGSITLNSADNGASWDIFHVKCDPSGNVLWAKMAGSTSGAYPTSVTTDAAGNSYITGWFTSSTLNFGLSTVTNIGNYNSFLTRYDPSGNVVWARTIGGSNYDLANSVSADAAGYCYVTGRMQSLSITVGAYTITNSDTTGNTSDIFFVKYAPNGTVMWATRAGKDNAYDEGRSVISDSIGNAYLTGYFSDDSSITFGSVSSNTVTGSCNIFVAKFSPSGNASWAKAVGDTGGCAEGASIAINQSGDCYITGYFNGATLDFGSIILSNPLMYGQFYIAKTGEEAGIHSNELVNYVSVYPNPATTNAIFQFTGLGGNKTLIIYDQLGKEIWRKETIENQIEFSAEDFAAGLYFYHLEQNGEIVASGKLVVQ